MAIKSALWGLGGAIALAGLISAPAFAGHVTGHGPNACPVGVNCAPDIRLVPGPVGHDSVVTIQNRTPYDYLDTVHFQRDPHVTITRVHGMMPTVALDDFPSEFHGDCDPESTVYCRKDHGKPVEVTLFEAKPAPKPYIAPPPPPAPVKAVPTERLVAVGGGYDPSKFKPRVYGDPYTITPGIAHVPTSIVDRDPARAQAVLDSGKAVLAPWTPGGTTPALTGLPVQRMTPPPVPMGVAYPNMMPPPNMRPPMVQQAPRPVMMPPVMAAPRAAVPAPAFVRGPVMGSIPTGMPGAAGAPVLQANGTYASTVGADGTYWEKVSGPTVVGGLPATSVICKRKLPTQVVRPVLAGAPHPVPVQPECEPHKSRY